jgi:predicted lipid-binding transport protein (Tim44 family)
VARAAASVHDVLMTALAVTLLIIGIVLLLFGVFVEAVQFLLWIGIIILVIAVIMWLMRFIRRQT